MGGSQSKPEEERIFEAGPPVQLSPGLADYITQEATSTNVPPARQSTLDDRVRERIQSGVSELREKESEIEQEIQAALNKETLEKKVEENDQIVDGKLRSSLSLQNDLDEIRQKVDRYHARREFAGVKEVEQKAQAVAECYKNHSTTSLECWQEVEEFKASVASIEKQYIESFR